VTGSAEGVRMKVQAGAKQIHMPDAWPEHLAPIRLVGVGSSRLGGTL
jgi:hypothetical protein